MTTNQSHSARVFLQREMTSADPDSLEGAVVRHLLDCVERFGEDAFAKAAAFAERLAEMHLRSGAIVRLNDEFRRNPLLGPLLITSGVRALGKDTVTAALLAVREFDAFTRENDPWGEHDFGAVSVDGRRLFWKIDAYDRDRRFHSPDPTDPNVTTRVLTIMLPEEY